MIYPDGGLRNNLKSSSLKSGVHSKNKVISVHESELTVFSFSAMKSLNQKSERCRKTNGRLNLAFEIDADLKRRMLLKRSLKERLAIYDDEKVNGLSYHKNALGLNESLRDDWKCQSTNDGLDTSAPDCFSEKFSTLLARCDIMHTLSTTNNDYYSSGEDSPELSAPISRVTKLNPHPKNSKSNQRLSGKQMRPPKEEDVLNSKKLLEPCIPKHTLKKSHAVNLTCPFNPDTLRSVRRHIACQASLANSIRSLQRKERDMREFKARPLPVTHNRSCQFKKSFSTVSRDLSTEALEALMKDPEGARMLALLRKTNSDIDSSFFSSDDDSSMSHFAEQASNLSREFSKVPTSRKESYGVLLSEVSERIQRVSKGSSRDIIGRNGGSSSAPSVRDLGKSIERVSKTVSADTPKVVSTLGALLQSGASMMERQKAWEEMKRQHLAEKETIRREKEEAILKLASLPPVDSSKSLNSWFKAKAQNEANKKKEEVENAQRMMQRQLKISANEKRHEAMCANAKKQELANQTMRNQKKLLCHHNDTISKGSNMPNKNPESASAFESIEDIAEGHKEDTVKPPCQITNNQSSTECQIINNANQQGNQGVMPQQALSGNIQLAGLSLLEQYEARQKASEIEAWNSSFQGLCPRFAHKFNTSSSTSTMCKSKEFDNVDNLCIDSSNLNNKDTVQWEILDREGQLYRRWENGKVEQFFDRATSTSSKGRFHVHDARNFDAVTMKCIPGPDSGITLLKGQEISGLQREMIITIMFDRLMFNDAEAIAWWNKNKESIIRC